MDIASILIFGSITIFVICLIGGWHESRREKKNNSRNWTSKEWQEYLQEVQKRLDE